MIMFMMMNWTENQLMTNILTPQLRHDQVFQNYFVVYKMTISDCYQCFKKPYYEIWASFDVLFSFAVSRCQLEQLLYFFPFSQISAGSFSKVARWYSMHKRWERVCDRLSAKPANFDIQKFLYLELWSCLWWWIELRINDDKHFDTSTETWSGFSELFCVVYEIELRFLEAILTKPCHAIWTEISSW